MNKILYTIGAIIACVILLVLIIYPIQLKIKENAKIQTVKSQVFKTQLNKCEAFQIGNYTCIKCGWSMECVKIEMPKKEKVTPIK